MWCKFYKNKVQWQYIEVLILFGRDFEKVILEFCCIYVCDVRKFMYDIYNMLFVLQNCWYFEIGKDLKILDVVCKV